MDTILLNFCHWVGNKGYKINGYDDSQLNKIIELFLSESTTDVGEQEDAYVIQLEDALVGLVGWFDKYKEMLDKVFKLSDDDTKMQVTKAVTEAKRVLDLKR